MNILSGAFLTLTYPDGTEEKFLLDRGKIFSQEINDTWRFTGVPSNIRPETFTIEIGRDMWPRL
mgnify:CR=1 FL=1